MRKKGIILVIVTCIVVVLYGFITISNSLPKFIKDRSSLKINYSLFPFDFRMNFGDYSLYVNQKIFTNIKDSSARLFIDIENKLSNDSTNVMNNASKLINNTSNVFKNMEIKISNTIQNKVK